MFEEYQKDPIEFAEKKEEEAKEAGLPDVEKLWKKHRTKLEELDGDEGEENGLAQQAEEVIAYSEATQMLEVLEEGPTWWRRLIWRISDAGAYISSFFEWIGSFFAEILEWLQENSAVATGWVAYPVAIIAWLWAAYYTISNALVFQLFIGGIIVGLGLLFSMVNADDSSSEDDTDVDSDPIYPVAQRNFYGVVLVLLVVVFTTWVNWAPHSHYGVVVMDENGTVTRMIEPSDNSFDALGLDPMFWYSSRAEEVVDLENHTVSVEYKKRPLFGEGDVLETPVNKHLLTDDAFEMVVKEELNALDQRLPSESVAKQIKQSLEELSTEEFELQIESVEIESSFQTEVNITSEQGED